MSSVRRQKFDIPQRVDGGHTLFHRVRCTTGLLRSLSGCHLCRTNPDYGLREVEDNIRIILTRILLDEDEDESLLYPEVVELFATFPGTSTLKACRGCRAEQMHRLATTALTDISTSFGKTTPANSNTCTFNNVSSA